MIPGSKACLRHVDTSFDMRVPQNIVRARNFRIVLVGRGSPFSTAQLRIL